MQMMSISISHISVKKSKINDMNLKNRF